MSHLTLARGLTRSHNHKYDTTALSDRVISTKYISYIVFSRCPTTTGLYRQPFYPTYNIKTDKVLIAVKTMLMRILELVQCRIKIHSISAFKKKKYVN